MARRRRDLERERQALADRLPPRVAEVEQRAVVVMPTACPRCHSVHLTRARETGVPGPPRRISCFVCGWDAYFVRATGLHHVPGPPGLVRPTPIPVRHAVG